MRAVSVIVPAYNEEQNIAPLLRRIAETSSGEWLVDDIIVIASGCTDLTVERALGVQAEGKPVRVEVQTRREGKASAINVGLRAAKHDVVVLVSGDVLPSAGAITAMLRRFEDDSVGVVGARPVPMNDESTFTGFATHLLWRLHHAVCEASDDNPKCGEMIAFRRRDGTRTIVHEIPVESAVDEVSIQALVHAAGLRSAYAGDAVVSNWGPFTIRDWFAQRRRINTGHVIEARNGNQPSTMRPATVLRALAGDREARRRLHWLLAVVTLEVAARICGYYDAARGRGHTVWKVAATTKRAFSDKTG